MNYACVKNVILKHIGWYENHTVKNSEITVKVKLILSLSMKKKFTLRDIVILEKLKQTLKSLGKSFCLKSSKSVSAMTLKLISVNRK